MKEQSLPTKKQNKTKIQEQLTQIMSLGNDRELFKNKKSDWEISQNMFIIIATSRRQIKTVLRFYLITFRINKILKEKRDLHSLLMGLQTGPVSINVSFYFMTY